METPYLCPDKGHNNGGRKPILISGIHVCYKNWSVHPFDHELYIRYSSPFWTIYQIYIRYNTYIYVIQFYIYMAAIGK